MVKDKIKGFKVIVEGQYYSTSGNKDLRGFKQTFYLPEVVTYREGNTYRKVKIDGKWVDTTEVIPVVKKGNVSKGNLALHLIRRFYLEFKLREDLEDFVKVRTCRIFSIKEEMIKQDDFLKKDINDLTEAELNQFVLIRDLNVYLTAYGSLVAQKEAVKEAYKQKLLELSEKKEKVTEETNIYQAELDRLEEGPVSNNIDDLFT